MLFPVIIGLLTFVFKIRRALGKIKLWKRPPCSNSACHIARLTAQRAQNGNGFWCLTVLEAVLFFCFLTLAWTPPRSRGRSPNGAAQISTDQIRLCWFQNRARAELLANSPREPAFGTKHDESRKRKCRWPSCKAAETGPRSAGVSFCEAQKPVAQIGKSSEKKWFRACWLQVCVPGIKVAPKTSTMHCCRPSMRSSLMRSELLDNSDQGREEWSHCSRFRQALRMPTRWQTKE